MKTKKTVVFFLLGAALTGLVFFLAGCAAEHPSFASAEITTNPPGVDVVNVQDNAAMGTTPFTFVKETEGREAEYTTVKMSKPGYEDKIISFFMSPKHDSEEDAKNDPQKVEANLMQK